MYGGKRNGDALEDWLAKMEKYFRIQPRIDDQMILLATLHFENSASTWWRAREEDELAGREIPLVTWKNFKSEMRRVFFDEDYERRVLLVGLCILAVLLPWALSSRNLEKSVNTIASTFQNELLSHARDAVTAVLEDGRANAVLLARLIISASRHQNLSSFATLEEEVRPVLFLIYSMLSGIAQVTYYGTNGLFLSYKDDSNGTSIVFANATYLYKEESDSAPISTWRKGEDLAWYHQSVNGSTGLPFGEASSAPPFPFWGLELFKKTVNAHEGLIQDTYFVMGGDLQNLVLMLTAPVWGDLSKGGAVGIGFNAINLQKILGKIDRKGGEIYITTEDGRLVAETGIQFSVDGNELSKVVSVANEYLLNKYPEYSRLAHEPLEVDGLNVLGIHYAINTLPIHVSNTTLVFVLVFPRQYLWGPIEMRGHKIYVIFVSLLVSILLSAFFLVLLFTKGNSSEMFLRAALIQQLEATKLAESKSGHKTLVFANMSHDLRTPLAAIFGLIDLCVCDATENSELKNNLLQMKSCATDLLGILNSILDMSKIEAGKLQMRESDFSLVKSLEQVVDTFYIHGLNKGVEVVLDLSDEIVEKAYWVRGDAGRLKQVINNLLSNGIKFTNEGHVVVRAWVKPPYFESRGSGMGCEGGFCDCYYWPQPFQQEKEVCSSRVVDDNYVEIVFEVDDTGRGIPKERWKAVFENFVQVEGSSVPRNYDGTGLGLGIVRSLVRMMGGDISIIDKDGPGEAGTRFRFNLVFKTSQKQLVAVENKCFSSAMTGSKKSSESSLTNLDVDNTTMFQRWDCGSISIEWLHGPHLDKETSVPPLNLDSIYVLLAMQGQAGKKVLTKWLERRGLQVCEMNSWNDFAFTMERIKQELSFHSSSDSERIDNCMPRENQFCEGFANDEVGSIRSGERWFLPPSRCTSSMGLGNRIHSTQVRFLVLLDIGMLPRPLDAMHSELKEMFDGIYGDPPHHCAMYFKLVWLVSPKTPKSDLDALSKEDMCGDLLLRKPLQVTRLNKVWKLTKGLMNDVEENPGQERGKLFPGESSMPLGLPTQNVEDAKDTDKWYLSQRGGKLLSGGPLPDKVLKVVGNPRFLSDMHILIAEDNTILQRLAKTMLIREGASVECVNDGAEAARRVLENLYQSRTSFCSNTVDRQDTYISQVAALQEGKRDRPFDLVLMDCEMPVLNGYEATKRIREEESRYGIRTPVIALTAHAMAQDEKKCIEAGMDFYLTKPLALSALLKALQNLSP